MKKILLFILSIFCISNSYAEDVVQVVPFIKPAGTGLKADGVSLSGQMTDINLYSDTKQYVALQFSLYVPSGLKIGFKAGSRCYKEIDWDDSVIQCHKVSASKAQQDENMPGYDFYVVSITDQETPNHVFVGNSGKDVVKLAYGIPSTMENGTYKIYMKNIKLIVSGTEKVEIPNATSYFVVGNESSLPTVNLDGFVSSAVINQLPNGANIDLTGATQVYGACANNINNSYSREVANEWNTICLPFDAQSTDAVKFYEITSVGSDALEVAAVKKLAAGTPALAKVTGSTLTVEGTGAISTTLNNGTMKGTFRPINVTESGTYYIKGGQFWEINDNFNVGAFKAYFTNVNGNAKGNVLDIVEDATAINAVSADLNGIEEIYGVNGTRQQNLQNGLNIVKIGDKVMKVLVK